MTQRSVSTSASSQQQRRRSRRSTRQRRSQPNQHLVVPYITRRIPAYELLHEEGLLKIEQAADTILAEIGVEFRDDPETMELFARAGAQVTPVTSSAWNIKFEPGMIREILKTAPQQFTQHARNPANSVVIGGDPVVFTPAYGSPFVMDMDQSRRYGTPADF